MKIYAGMFPYRLIIYNLEFVLWTKNCEEKNLHYFAWQEDAKTFSWYVVQLL